MGNKPSSDENTERFTLSWIGKSKAIKEYEDYNTEFLFKANEQRSVNFNTTENIIIEGDNLDALKLLQTEYYSKIKMIYIDPPYNTGKKGAYKDKFYKGRECKHSQWLSMMYPRLKLARELLRDDGVIFVSIDDNEQANLKLLMDEVFGGENFVSNIIWEKKMGRQNDATHISTNHEYILFFTRRKSDFNINLLDRTYDTDKGYKNPDNDYRGNWISITLQAKSGNDKNFEFTFPNGIKWKPPHGTYSRYSKKKLLLLYNDNRIYFGANNNNIPRVKKFISEVKQGLTPVSIFYSQDVSNTQKGKLEIKKLFFDLEHDTTPKPIALIKRMLDISTKEGDLTLDFFAGSGTTGHAVMEMNLENKKKAIENGEDPTLVGNRKYIMVQLPELIDEKREEYKEVYKKISDITIERVKRAGNKISEENPDINLADIDLDIGFKVFELTENN